MSPEKAKKKDSPVAFYWDDNGRRADKDLHNPILEAGDFAAAKKVSRKIAKETGLTDEDIDSLFGE